MKTAYSITPDGYPYMVTVYETEDECKEALAIWKALFTPPKGNNCITVNEQCNITVNAI